MDEVSQQNASLVEEAAAAAESLQDQAGNLAQVVSVFKLDTANAVVLADHGAVTRQVATVTKVIGKIGPARAAPPDVARGAAPARRFAVAPAKAMGGEWEEF